MNLLKRIMGFVWMVIAPVVIYFLITGNTIIYFYLSTGNKKITVNKILFIY